MYIDKRLVNRYCSELIGMSPSLYVGVMRYRMRNTHAYKQIVSRDTKLLVEGFPRCANSFAVMAIRSVNDPIRIATHLHSTAHILKGIKYNLPTLVVIRNPDAAIPSVLALGVQLGKAKHILENESAKIAYVRYWTAYFHRFYERLCPYRDKFILAEFNETIKDLNQFILAINKKYALNLVEFNHTKENVDAIFSATKVHLSPSSEREELKEAFTRAYFDEENIKLRNQANATYAKILSL